VDVAFEVIAPGRRPAFNLLASGRLVVIASPRSVDQRREAMPTSWN
jgi:hypothetical protein